MALSEITNTVYVHVKMVSGVANETHSMKIIVTINNPFEDNTRKEKANVIARNLLFYICVTCSTMRCWYFYTFSLINYSFVYALLIYNIPC